MSNSKLLRMEDNEKGYEPTKIKRDKGFCPSLNEWAKVKGCKMSRQVRQVTMGDVSTPIEPKQEDHAPCESKSDLKDGIHLAKKQKQSKLLMPHVTVKEKNVSSNVSMEITEKNGGSSSTSDVARPTSTSVMQDVNRDALADKVKSWHEIQINEDSEVIIHKGKHSVTIIQLNK